MPQPKIPQPTRSRRVVTVMPESRGAPVAQEALPVVEFLDMPRSTGPAADFPRQGFADWSMQEFKERQLKNWSSYRYTDVLVWALFSQQAYFDFHPAYDLMKQAFPTLSYTRYLNNAPAQLGWDELYIEGNRIIVLPGTESLTELISYVGFAMSPVTGQDPNILYFTGLQRVFADYEAAIWDQYHENFQANEPSTLLTGHSLGGILANYLAYRINLRAGTQVGERGPVYSAFTYGAPASYVHKLNMGDFWPHHYHVRVIALGDPVPGITQAAVLDTPNLVFRFGSDFKVPLHYDSRSITLTAPGKMESLQRAIAEPFYKALRNSYPTVRDGVTSHGAANYVQECFRACRAERDTPFPLFNALIAWADLLAGGQLPKRAV